MNTSELQHELITKLLNVQYFCIVILALVALIICVYSIIIIYGNIGKRKELQNSRTTLVGTEAKSYNENLSKAVNQCNDEIQKYKTVIFITLFAFVIIAIFCMSVVKLL